MLDIRDFFQKKYLDDDREPVFIFGIPGMEGSFGLFAPQAGYWLQLISVYVIGIVVQVFCSVLVYNFIVVPRRKRNGCSSSSSGRNDYNSFAAFIFGYGIIVPSVIAFPYWLLDYLDVHNKVFASAATQVSLVVTFRTIEAMHDTSPRVVEDSLINYVAYYSATVRHVWDEKTRGRVRVGIVEAIRNLLRVLFYYHALSILNSFMIFHDFSPLESTVVLNDLHLNLDLFRPGHLMNTYLLGVLTYFFILVGAESANLAENFKGYKTTRAFNNPLWGSKSPTDFWGRRWNTMIHKILKGGVFLPSRKYFPAPIAAFITFMMSGALHVFVWTVIFYQHNKQAIRSEICYGCFFPTFLKLMAFFSWCGVTCGLERLVGELYLFRWMTRNLPLVVKSTLVVALTLPIGHWFSGDWAMGGYFQDFTMGLWHVDRIH